MIYCADTWFVLAAFDRDPKATQMLRGLQAGKDFLIVSYIVYSETFRKLYQRGIAEIDIQSFFGFLERTEKVQFIPLNDRIGREAAKISLTYSLSLIDACVVATAKMLDCDILLSKDSDYELLTKRKYLKVQSW